MSHRCCDTDLQQTDVQVQQISLSEVKVCCGTEWLCTELFGGSLFLLHALRWVMEPH